MTPPKATHIKRSSLEALKNKLLALPANDINNKDELTPRESVLLLRPTLEDLRDKKGYSIGQLCELLAKDGIRMSPATLRSYMAEGVRASKKTRKKPAEQGEAVAAPVAQ